MRQVRVEMRAVTVGVAVERCLCDLCGGEASVATPKREPVLLAIDAQGLQYTPEYSALANLDGWARVIDARNTGTSAREVLACPDCRKTRLTKAGA